jgi:adenosylcobinamide-phosphate synthase
VFISFTITSPLFFFYQPSLLFYCLDSLAVYFALGLNSLKLHAKQIETPLLKGNLKQARFYISWMVSRDTENLNQSEISRASVESVLENGHDAAIATLFYYLIGGAPLVIVHRLANTLDAMWGYKNKRFINFGWFAAKADDWLGWPSAKLSALLYWLSAKISGYKTSSFLDCVKLAYHQAKQYKSLNGGWVISIGAQVLNLKLGGDSVYDNQRLSSTLLGNKNGQTPSVRSQQLNVDGVIDSSVDANINSSFDTSINSNIESDISTSIKLVETSCVILIVSLFILAALFNMVSASPISGVGL